MPGCTTPYALTAVLKPFVGIPILISGRRSLSDYKEQFGPFERGLDKVARWSSDAFVANSYIVREDVATREGIDPARIEVVRNGVLLPDPMPLADRQAWRASWGCDDEHVVVGCVASVKPGKGVELLIDVAAEGLRAREPQLRYVIVGDGVSRPALEADVARRGLGDVVRFHGIEPDARKLYGAFDIAVQASDSEGLPNAVLEPAAAGIAIVATAAGGTPMIIDGQTGVASRSATRARWPSASRGSRANPSSGRSWALSPHQRRGVVPDGPDGRGHGAHLRGPRGSAAARPTAQTLAARPSDASA